MWASNSQQPSPTGAESCGSATAGTTFSGGSYTNTFSYTHLGQLWHAPVNGTGGYQQYLYCNSAAPHQLTNIVPAGKGYSCSNLPPTNTYAVGYDNWGNVTSRTYDQQTATLSYNKLDEMVEWQIPNTNQAWYAYDSSGERTLQRTTIGSTTTMTVYAFGLEEYDYDGSGNLQNSTHYYTLGGRLLGELQQSGSTSTTNYFLTDNLGSVLAVFNSVSSSAALLSTQLYAPYGAARFTAGTPGNYTNKGYTGQYNDSVSGLDYYNARYYDPVSSVFLSADTVEGNDNGMNPYAYAGGNPATYSDPSGMMYTCGPGCGNGGSGNQQGDYTGTPPLTTPPSTQIDPDNPLTWPKLIPADPAVDAAVGASWLCPICLGVAAVGAIVLTLATPTNLDPGVLSQPIIPTGPDIQPTKAVNSLTEGHSMVTPSPPTHTGGSGANPPGGGHPPTSPAGEPCSFTPNTQVATATGEQTIGKLHVGEKVWAYNPKTKKMELQPIEHVWIHQDSDLVDLTITYQKPAQHGKANAKGQSEISEVVHTTSEHPFYTTEHGFTPAGKLKAGMHILRADGSVGVVTQTRLVHRTKTMYNLEVAHDHTFVVGSGQWIVHNKCGPEDYKQLRENMENAGVEFKAGQQAHHIIPCALENHPLIQATDGLFDKNAAYNGRALFGNNYQEEALQDGEPYHWFHNTYTARVRGIMNQAYQNLAESGVLNEPGYGQQMAMTSLLEIIASLDTDIIQQGLTSVWTNLACLLS